MSYIALFLVVVLLAIVWLGMAYRRHELEREQCEMGERERAREQGSHAPRLQHPEIDLAKCLGCGACLRACPEEGVLGMIHGQSAVVHGAYCVGHGLCAEACPVGAVSLTIADLATRRDLPVLTSDLEVPKVRGLFLAGEVTGRALIHSAVEQGRRVAEIVASRTRSEQPLDLVIVGAGPAGFACALEALERGLRIRVIDQEPLGGTVAKYPRRKLVMTRALEFPRGERLEGGTYAKEQLLERWRELALRHGLGVEEGVRFLDANEAPAGGVEVRTSDGVIHASACCLAVGRRGTPRRLEVPGEELAKLQYALQDAASYEHERVLVVGGGDTAIEAALALCEQPGNQVTISYRRERFRRLHPRNREAIAGALESQRVQVLFETSVTQVFDAEVELEGPSGKLRLENDTVFAMLGGEPPFEGLQRAGVSFDPQDRAELDHSQAERTGLLRGLGVALVGALLAFAWATWRGDYYGLELSARPLSERHELLRPSAAIGLVFGVAALALVFANLGYLLRRAQGFPLRFGSLRAWMSLHVATGILALVAATLHAGLRAGDTQGGHAWWGLIVLVASGAIGRYVYSLVPHAANGRELVQDEVRAELARLSAELEACGSVLVDEVSGELDALVHWKGTLLSRSLGLLRARAQLRSGTRVFRELALNEGLSRSQAWKLGALTERAKRAALAAAHFDDLRWILSAWRHVHRWIALLLMLVLAVHVYDALIYGKIFG